jgi:hypothetical protein
MQLADQCLSKLTSETDDMIRFAFSQNSTLQQLLGLEEEIGEENEHTATSASKRCPGRFPTRAEGRQASWASHLLGRQHSRRMSLARTLDAAGTHDQSPDLTQTHQGYAGLSTSQGRRDRAHTYQVRDCVRR